MSNLDRHLESAFDAIIKSLHESGDYMFAFDSEAGHQYYMDKAKEEGLVNEQYSLTDKGLEWYSDKSLEVCNEIRWTMLKNPRCLIGVPVKGRSSV